MKLNKAEYTPGILILKYKEKKDYKGVKAIIENHGLTINNHLKRLQFLYITVPDRQEDKWIKILSKEKQVKVVEKNWIYHTCSC